MHGDWQALWRLLREVGAVDQQGKRVSGYRLIQVGDLAHLGADVYGGDALAVWLGEQYFDDWLLGNHEAPFAYPGLPKFAHMRREHELHPLTQQLIHHHARQGFKVAAACGEWLVTHAGLHWHWQEKELEEVVAEGPAATAEYLNERFLERVVSHEKDPLFDSYGPVRGGDPQPGGVLWMDSSELTRRMGRNRVPQIIGHTARRAPKLLGGAQGNVWAIDAGCGVSGNASALVRADGKEWEPVLLRVRRFGPLLAARQGDLPDLLPLEPELERLVGRRLEGLAL